MRITLRDVGFQITFLNCFWRIARHKLHVGYTIKCNNREEISLFWCNVPNHVPKRLSNSGYSHHTIFCSAYCQRWYWVVKNWFTIFLDTVVVSMESRTHKNLSLNFFWMIQSVFLWHYSSKRMTSHNHIVTFKSLFAKFDQSLFDVEIDQNWFWSIKYKLWQTHPNSLTLECSLLLNLLCNCLIGWIITIHPVNPNYCDISAWFSDWREKNCVSNSIFSCDQSR